jgi:hypothetical protein
MAMNRQELLDALRFELRFVDHGGDQRSVREPRKELSVFRDSPSCLNYGSVERTHACSECFLMNFVPRDRRGASIPCHQIPLNDRGDTLESLQGDGQDFQVQESLRLWLQKTIAKMETDLAPSAVR